MAFYRDMLGFDVWVKGEEQAILKTTSGQQLEVSELTNARGT